MRLLSNTMRYHLKQSALRSLSQLHSGDLLGQTAVVIPLLRVLCSTNEVRKYLFSWFYKFVAVGVMLMMVVVAWTVHVAPSALKNDVAFACAFQHSPRQSNPWSFAVLLVSGNFSLEERAPRLPMLG